MPLKNKPYHRFSRDLLVPYFRKAKTVKAVTRAEAAVPHSGSNSNAKPWAAEDVVLTLTALWMMLEGMLPSTRG